MADFPSTGSLGASIGDGLERFDHGACEPAMIGLARF